MSAHMEVATQIDAPTVTAGTIYTESVPMIPIMMAMAIKAKPDNGDQSVRQ